MAKQVHIHNLKSDSEKSITVHEAVYDIDGHLVTDDINMGTYNFVGPSNAKGHYEYDVAPFYEWGNTEKQGGKGFRKENILAVENILKYLGNENSNQRYFNILKQIDPNKYQQIIYYKNMRTK